MCCSVCRFLSLSASLPVTVTLSWSACQCHSQSVCCGLPVTVSLYAMVCLSLSLCHGLPVTVCMSWPVCHCQSVCQCESVSVYVMVSLVTICHGQSVICHYQYVQNVVIGLSQSVCHYQHVVISWSASSICHGQSVSVSLSPTFCRFHSFCFECVFVIQVHDTLITLLYHQLHSEELHRKHTHTHACTHTHTHNTPKHNR